MSYIRIVPKILPDSNLWRGVIIERDGAVVKIEPNLIIRGTVFPCEERELSKNAEELFEISMSIRTLSLADMYAGMTRIEIKYGKLLEAREELISKIKNHLTDNEKMFLLSFKKREPDWNLLGLKGIEELPAVRWKLINLDKMSATKHLAALDKLKKVLGF